MRKTALTSPFSLISKDKVLGSVKESSPRTETRVLGAWEKSARSKSGEKASRS
ncbi:MAG: hypothetical protein LBW85_10855 [Deltaproteobacteria bacterium]|nr:hypothetical protein [Deltaproteobacteria bacterium]